MLVKWDTYSLSSSLFSSIFYYLNSVIVVSSLWCVVVYSMNDVVVVNLIIPNVSVWTEHGWLDFFN